VTPAVPKASPEPEVKQTHSPFSAICSPLLITKQTLLTSNTEEYDHNTWDTCDTFQCDSRARSARDTSTSRCRPKRPCRNSKVLSHHQLDIEIHNSMAYQTIIAKWDLEPRFTRKSKISIRALPLVSRSLNYDMSQSKIASLILWISSFWLGVILQRDQAQPEKTETFPVWTRRPRQSIMGQDNEK